MQNPVLAAITSEQIVQSKLSTIVTEDCVVIPSFSGQPHTVLSLSSIAAIKVVKISYPSLLVISAGLFLLAAAAGASKDGGGTAWPIGILGLLFFLAYLVSQRARVVFMNGSETSQTPSGSFADVADLVSAVEIARANLSNTSSVKFSTPGHFTRVRQILRGLLSPRIRTWVPGGTL